MKENFNRGGRPPKLNPAVYRYVVRFDAAENSAFLAICLLYTSDAADEL